MSVPKNNPDLPEDAPATQLHAPRPLTVAQNVVLTLKVLGAAGLLLIALWAASLWTAA